MLLTIVEVLSCENPDCRDFAKVAMGTRGARSYYCPICGKISYARGIDVNLASNPELYKTYLSKAVASASNREY